MEKQRCWVLGKDRSSEVRPVDAAEAARLTELGYQRYTFPSPRGKTEIAYAEVEADVRALERVMWHQATRDLESASLENDANNSVER